MTAALEARQIETLRKVREWRSRHSVETVLRMLREVDSVRRVAHEKIDDAESLLRSSKLNNEVENLVRERVHQAVEKCLEDARADLSAIVTSRWTGVPAPAQSAVLSALAAGKLAAGAAAVGSTAAAAAGVYVATTLAVSVGVFTTTVSAPILAAGAGLTALGIASGVVAPIQFSHWRRRRLKKSVDQYLDEKVIGVADKNPEKALIPAALAVLDDAALYIERQTCHDA